MKGCLSNCAALVCQKTFFIPFVFFAAIEPSAAVINSWTNPTSSSWEFQTNWSLGTLPDQSQSVYITNAGFKAVAIGPNTAQNFPASMQIQDLQIATPSNSFNVLLMNFSGFQVPLQTTGVSVGPNSSIIVQSSWLEDTGGMSVSGTFNQGDFARVQVNGPVQIFNSAQFGGGVTPGSYFLRMAPSGRTLDYLLAADKAGPALLSNTAVLTMSPVSRLARRANSTSTTAGSPPLTGSLSVLAISRLPPLSINPAERSQETCW